MKSRVCLKFMCSLSILAKKTKTFDCFMHDSLKRDFISYKSKERNCINFYHMGLHEIQVNYLYRADNYEYYYYGLKSQNWYHYWNRPIAYGIRSDNIRHIISATLKILTILVLIL